jgi:hypothetical protein
VRALRRAEGEAGACWIRRPPPCTSSAQSGVLPPGRSVVRCIRMGDPFSGTTARSRVGHAGTQAMRTQELPMTSIGAAGRRCPPDMSSSARASPALVPRGAPATSAPSSPLSADSGARRRSRSTTGSTGRTSHRLTPPPPWPSHCLRVRERSDGAEGVGLWGGPRDLDGIARFLSLMLARPTLFGG